jgi:hypothetical protein
VNVGVLLDQLADKRLTGLPYLRIAGTVGIQENVDFASIATDAELWQWSDLINPFTPRIFNFANSPTPSPTATSSDWQQLSAGSVRPCSERESRLFCLDYHDWDGRVLPQTVVAGHYIQVAPVAERGQVLPGLLTVLDVGVVTAKPASTTLSFVIDVWE